MSETSGGNPPKRRTSLSGDRAREISGIDKPKHSLLSKARNVVLAGLGIAGAGAAIEATAHPAENVTNAVVQGAENIKQGGESLVDFYNKDAIIRQKSEEVAGKLNGSIPLSEGEQIFEKVRLVPAGATFEEQQKMKKEGTPINVRNYPGTNTPDGRFTSIIGELLQGTEIDQVILITGTNPHPTTASEEANWWAFNYHPEDIDPNKPGQIGYVYGIYGTAQAIGDAASSTPAPSVDSSQQ